MKQAKKMLCMLLVMLLAFSTVSIGVSAAYTSYATPNGQTLHEEATYTTEQRSSQLLDFVDEMLYEMRDDLYIDITIMTLDFTSVDNALDTIEGLEGAAGLIGGDVGDLDIDALGSTRRGTAGKTDLNILYELLYFLNANRGIVGNFVRGELDLGIIATFVDLDFDIHNLLVDMLYEMMVDETYDPDVATIDYSVWTADKIIQHGIDVILLGGTAADGDVEEGFLPSMAGKTNINTQTIWTIIENAANAATKDILLPFIKNDLSALIDDLKASTAEVEGAAEAWALIDISKLNLDSYVWGQYDKTNGIVAELNHFLYVVIDQVWTGDKFWVDGGNELLESNLASAIKIIYEKLGKAILPASAEFLPQDEINAMDFEELVCYVALQFLRSEMPYLLFETADSSVEVPTNDVGALACTVAYSILAELPINLDYMTDFEWGDIAWDKDTALEIICDIGAYYLNGALPVEINYGEGIEMLLTKLVNWALGDNNFGGFFKGCGISSSDSPWTKIDKTVLAVLPLHQILGGGATGSYDLIMNKLLGNIFDLNLEGILSLLYKTDYSLLNNTAPVFIVNILNRVLNVIVSKNTQSAIFNPNPSSIDSLIQNSNLATSAEKLLNGLYNAGSQSFFWSSLLPILNPLLVDESGYACNQKSPADGYVATTSLESLQAYIETVEAVMAAPDDPYELDATLWNESEDYRLWRYDQLEDAIDDAWGVIDGYNGAVAWVAEANEQLVAANASGDATAIEEATNNLTEANAAVASYTSDVYNNAGKNISYYADKAVNDQNIASVKALEYILYVIEYTKDYDSSAYPEDVWENYEKALDHANEIVAIFPETGSGANPELKQSMVNAARRELMDAMRLLEIDLADLTALVEALAEAKKADTNGKSQESVDHLNNLIAKAEEFVASSWIIDYQDEIDQLVEDLAEAVKNLVEYIAPELIEKVEGIQTAVSNSVSLIYNFATGLTKDDLTDYVEVKNGELVIEKADNTASYVGTGSKIIVKDTAGNVTEEHTIVIFGDANGDGLIDVIDTILLDLQQSYSGDIAEGSAEWHALNVNGDSKVDASDVIVLDKYANFEGELDQSAITIK